MGIKHLWTVLAPFCDRKPLYELQGKTVAVDLSCWICEAQNIAEYQVQPRMYLRNLYFRTCYLLLMDVNPVFVLEGKAPQLKYDTISARNAIQFKGAKPKKDGLKTGKDRSRFHFVLRQCEEMLGYLGIACIKGNGEAESLCAYLNDDGLVDGCISQDSDCFAYGAKVVYRNFSISTQGIQSASGGAVDIYDIEKAYKALKLGRKKIVAMALLIGSDYSDGIHGIGKDSVLKFFENISDEEVLDRLRSWRNNESVFQNHEKQLNDKNICTSCGHSGKLQSHTRNGCKSCETAKGCDQFKYKDERVRVKNEVAMRSKAMQDPNFPDEAIIKEFLDRKDHVKELELTWKQPNLVQFVKFTTKFLQWEEIYSFQKILPILTRWQCRYYKVLQTQPKLKGMLKADRIKKVRNPKGVPSYEIIWSDPNEYFKGIIPENQIVDSNIELEKLWSTIEPQSLVETAYPELVEAFRQSKVKPKKAGKRKKRAQIDELSESLGNVSISEPKVKKPRKPRANKKVKEKKDIDELNSSFQLLTMEEDRPEDCDNKNEFGVRRKAVRTKTLDNFVKRAVVNSYNQKSLNCSMLDRISTPIKANRCPDLDTSSFGEDDEDDLDLSEIINEIVSKKHYPSTLKVVSTPEGSDVLMHDELSRSYSSSFFISNNPDGADLFEQAVNNTFNEVLRGNSSESCTDEDDLDDEPKASSEATPECPSSDDDSFCVKPYVPLYERLKRV
ncbi:hypothetical protein HUJ04_000838 [Dendroctonus ponderosae]